MAKNKTPRRKRYPVGSAQRREKMLAGERRRKLWEKSENFVRDLREKPKGTNHERLLLRRAGKFLTKEGLIS